MKTIHVLTLAAMSCFAATAAKAHYPAPVTPPAARAMQLWTDHPAAPTGDPRQDRSALLEMNRQTQLRAIQEKIAADRQRQAQAEYLRQLQCITNPPKPEPFNVPGLIRGAAENERLRQQEMIRRQEEAGQLKLRPDTSSQYERNLWRQNQHLFDDNEGHGATYHHGS